MCPASAHRRQQKKLVFEAYNISSLQDLYFLLCDDYKYFVPNGTNRVSTRLNSDLLIEFPINPVRDEIFIAKQNKHTQATLVAIYVFVV